MDTIGPSPTQPCDLLVIGGGATGLGVALQAALEGRQVVLVEARDFACGTSSRSTKLLHGGVRYLAQGRLRLVREALRERGVVLRLAPHLAQPLSFVVAEKSWLSWLLTWAGLKAYSWLAGRLSLGATQAVAGKELRKKPTRLPGAVAGVRYWDGQFDDARLAMALAKSAQAAGASMHNHTRVVSLDRSSAGWRAVLVDARTHRRVELQCRCVVNATGVWVDDLRRLALSDRPGADVPPPLVQPSQGVHLVVSREVLPLDEAVLAPRTSDGRVLFAIPWLGSTVIGTTDTPRTDAPLEPRPMRSELDFLFAETRRCLGVALHPSDVKSVWVGLRPLVVAGASDPANTRHLSREHLIVREAPGFVTVTGGKWTTYRAMAEEVMQTLVHHADLPVPPQTAHTQGFPLWGSPQTASSLVSLQQPPGVHLLGSHASALATLPGNDRSLGLGLTEAIVRYCARHEWAVTVEDMLARRWRTLFLDAQAAERIAPRVAEVLREETGLDPQLSDFLLLCLQYRLEPTP